MTQSSELPAILEEISYDDIQRIDVALEGDWSATVVTVWSRAEGLKGFDGVASEHPRFKPSLELYYSRSWVGIHCYRVIERGHEFDEDLARRIIEFVSARVRKLA